MNFLVGIISLCCGSWMSIYLYGLHADSSVKYNSVFIIFPVLLFLIFIYCIYLEIKKLEKKSN